MAYAQYTIPLQWIYAKVSARLNVRHILEILLVDHQSFSNIGRDWVRLNFKPQIIHTQESNLVVSGIQ